MAEVEPSMSGGPGKLLGCIEFPKTKSVTACCFGGDDLSDLYVTTAKLFDEDSENAGSLFVVRGVRSHAEGNAPVRGFPGRDADPAVAAGAK